MSIGSWDPGIGQDSNPGVIPIEWLQRCIQLSRDDQLQDLATQLDAAEVQGHADLMQLEADAWAGTASSMEVEELKHLVRFFTIAEDLPGWKSGHRSPVIAFARELKARGEKLDREFLLWIREHSDNRFLPYGPL